MTVVSVSVTAAEVKPIKVVATPPPAGPLHRTLTVVAESGPCRFFFGLEVLRFGLLAAGHVDLSLRLAAAFRRLIYKRRMGPFGESGGR